MTHTMKLKPVTSHPPLVFKGMEESFGLQLISQKFAPHAKICNRYFLYKILMYLRDASQ